MKIDYVVVGSGLTGATIARHLADAGREVLVVDRRAHVGGNVHDHVHESGIRVHVYGPHYFRTNSEELWEYVRRFGAFYTYEARVLTLVDGRLENWPIAASYIRRAAGEGWKAEFRGRPNNYEEACLAKMPRLVYERFVRGYTEKQWGVRATDLAPELARRFDIGTGDDSRLKRQRFQGLPVEGYSAWMRRMLNGVPVQLGFDYLRNREAVQARRRLIFTGPIDEFFGFRLGRLSYRGQQRESRYLPEAPYALAAAQVNNPQIENGPHIRTLEWKRMMPEAEASKIKGTLLTKELPISPSDPDQYEYPFPDGLNARLFAQYSRLAAGLSDVLICGRLGEYRYYDMDQAIARARLLARRILKDTDS